MGRGKIEIPTDITLLSSDRDAEKVGFVVWGSEQMKRLLVISAVLLVIPCLVLAGPIPDTGQTKCYDNTQEITCPNLGEPFYGQDANYGPNLHSYTKLDEDGNDLPDEATEWIMVRDNVTGLIWEVKTDVGTIHNNGDEYNWYDAQDYFIDTINSQNFGGNSDWRLPTIKELSTIVDSSISYPGPLINLAYFPNTQTPAYLSSTTYASNPNFAWAIVFTNGIVSEGDKSISFFSYVRAVRGGQTSNNFVAIGDGTVTDTATGLMWQQVETPVTYSWEQALSYCENLILNNDGEWTSGSPNSSGIRYNDWRLPNKNEMQSIVDYSTYNPSIDPIFEAELSHYWSSTTSAWHLESAWYVNFSYGRMFESNKSSDYHVRAVRCGIPPDTDCDTILDEEDNCLTNPNPLQENADTDGIGDLCDNCPNTSNPTQQDSYPPQGNNIGDVCDCECDFDCSGSVDANDVTAFLGGFGRSVFCCPCTNAAPCNGDVDCNANVDAADVTMFLEDFGRNQFNNPCPPCVAGAWCVY